MEGVSSPSGVSLEERLQQMRAMLLQYGEFLASTGGIVLRAATRVDGGSANATCRSPSLCRDAGVPPDGLFGAFLPDLRLAVVKTSQSTLSFGAFHSSSPASSEQDAVGLYNGGSAERWLDGFI